MSTVQTVTHFSVCGGIGSGAAGFNDADPSIGAIRGRMVCVGGIDVDPRACRDFKKLTGVEQACRDLFTLQQYRGFHGHDPAPGWREVTPADMRAAAHGHFPDIVFTSMPCKGFSGLLPQSKSTTAKYVALNELTERGVWLTLESFADNPPGLFIFENVPRIASRGRYLVDRITALARHYGYVHAETVHDCGELGEGLAQSRRRFLLVMRHAAKVPPFLYEPAKRGRLHAVGDVLRHMPLPGDEAAGPMHRVPQLQWQTWVRLAFVEAGSDWRSLNKLAIEDGKLRDYLILPEGTDWHSNVMGVRRWDQPVGTVTGNARQSTGSFSIADPRFAQSAKWSDGQAYGVKRWDMPSVTVSGQSMPGGGAYAIADPRIEIKHNNCFRVVRFDQPAGTVTGGGHPSAGGQAVADPRGARGDDLFGKFHCADWSGAARTVLARSGTGQGAFGVADPRPGMQRAAGDHYLTGGHYGVVPWSQPSGTVSASACHDNGPWSVADPRSVDAHAETQVDESAAMQLPAPRDKLVCRITALDGTWHRPFTTLELAALQSLIDPEEWFAPGGPGARGEQFVLDGESDQRWREGIGNAVPRKAAKAIGQVMGQTILLARSGETFALGSTPIWVQPLVVALSVAQGGV